MTSSPGALGQPCDAETASFVDLALGQGDPAVLAVLRSRLAADPAAALAFAETRQLLERLRGPAIEPSASFPGKLEGLLQKAERRHELRQVGEGPRWLWLAGAAAAVGMFAVLAWVDPLGIRTAPAREPALSLPLTSADDGAPGAAAEAAPLTATMAEAMDAVQRMLPDSTLLSALAGFQATPVGLSRWLSPRNALAMLQIDSELRRSAEARRRALRARGQSVELEDRVQQLAAGAAQQLRHDASLSPLQTALAMRAVLAAGNAESAALAVGARHLVARLPELDGDVLASALLALGELATATREHDEALRTHGERLIGEVLRRDVETWSRRRPRLLSLAAPAPALADAGRFLRFAPALGVDADQAAIVRLLLLAHLQERRAGPSETPEVSIAIVYGFDDLLVPAQRTSLEGRMRTWRPASLLPDYMALYQAAATCSPARAGYARFLLGLRSVAAGPTPDQLEDRAALCLCLATLCAPPALGE